MNCRGGRGDRGELTITLPGREFKKFGIAGMAVHNSYNAATLGFHTGTLARAGLVAFGFTNAMPVIAPVGGAKPVIGTNPLSFAVPGKKGSQTPSM